MVIHIDDICLKIFGFRVEEHKERCVIEGGVWFVSFRGRLERKAACVRMRERWRESLVIIVN